MHAEITRLMHDNMPDEWEKEHGLDPNDDDDGSAVLAYRYTNVEKNLDLPAGTSYSP